jgi:hypothetical protein
LQGEASALAASLARTVYFTVELVFGGWKEGSGPPAGANVSFAPEAEGARGGIINRPTIALIGEAGPEALIPLDRTRGNDPLPMTRTGSIGGGGNTINLTVNAGLGTDGAAVGRQLVEYIRKYERQSGKAFAAA